jgi:hypothetical protein
MSRRGERLFLWGMGLLAAALWLIVAVGTGDAILLLALVPMLLGMLGAVHTALLWARREIRTRHAIANGVVCISIMVVSMIGFAPVWFAIAALFAIFPAMLAAIAILYRDGRSPAS